MIYDVEIFFRSKENVEDSLNTLRKNFGETLKKLNIVAQYADLTINNYGFLVLNFTLEGETVDEAYNLSQDFLNLFTAETQKTFKDFEYMSKSVSISVANLKTA